jgi:hypothetical protein
MRAPSTMASTWEQIPKTPAVHYYLQYSTTTLLLWDLPTYLLSIRAAHL